MTSSDGCAEFIHALYHGCVTFKEEAHKLIESLPDDATWEDLMYEIYVHESIQRGLEDSRAGRTVSSQPAQTLSAMPNIEIVAHQPRWLEEFRIISSSLRAVLGDDARGSVRDSSDRGRTSHLPRRAAF